MTLPSALFLTPEPPVLGTGGGGIRSASLLEYLRHRYSVEVVSFALRAHSNGAAARLWRNGIRLARRRPPLYDRFSGYEAQLATAMRRKEYALGVVEHFWCASYADLLRQRCARLVLDLHNIESELARTHARVAPWPECWASERFAGAYEELERKWLPRFDTVLVASEEDRGRIRHPDIRVYPNALPEIARPCVPEENAIIFSGNLAYHPNVDAVHWFRRQIWPRVREQTDVEWRLIGRNPEAIRRLTAGDPRIRLVGPVDDAVAGLASAKLCIAPLRSGSGTRFKILEAWAAARAVVSTSLGAEGLTAHEGEHVLIADEPESLANAILDLLQNQERRIDIGNAGRALYDEKFTWPAAWRTLDESGPL